MWTVSMLEKAVSIIFTSVGLNTRPYFRVAILHLDIGLGEEAEDLRQQVALMLESFCAQSRQSSPSGTSSGIQWTCCWRFQKS
jgi:hypothetical protein